MCAQQVVEKIDRFLTSMRMDALISTGRRWCLIDFLTWIYRDKHGVFFWRDRSKALLFRIKLLSMFDVGKGKFSHMCLVKSTNRRESHGRIVLRISLLIYQIVDGNRSIHTFSLLFSHCQNCFFFQCRVPLHLIFDCKWSEEKTLSRLAKLSEMFLCRRRW